MPQYEFKCGECQHRFEESAAPGAPVVCPACGAASAERVHSAFAGPFTVGLRGAAAKRSNATRRVREEQRQEGFARARERRQQS